MSASNPWARPPGLYFRRNYEIKTGCFYPKSGFSPTSSKKAGKFSIPRQNNPARLLQPCGYLIPQYFRPKSVTSDFARQPGKGLGQAAHWSISPDGRNEAGFFIQVFNAARNQQLVFERC